MLVLEQEDQELYDRVQEKNLIRQYDLMTNCIEIGLQFDHTAFDKYMIWASSVPTLIEEIQLLG